MYIFFKYIHNNTIILIYIILYNFRIRKYFDLIIYNNIMKSVIIQSWSDKSILKRSSFIYYMCTKLIILILFIKKFTLMPLVFLG